MAGHFFDLNTSEVATGTALKTLAQVRAASNHGVTIYGATVSFEGTSATDPPILVELVRSDADGTKSDKALTETDPNHPDTLQSTGHENFSAEPGNPVVITQKYVHPQGSYTFPYPVHVAGGKAFGVRVTAGVDVGARVHLRGEE